MGSVYQDTIVTVTDAEDVFKQFEAIRAEACYMRGHGGYTGSFCEKNDVVLRADPEHDKPLDAEEARKRCLDNDKWGPAEAYYLGNTEAGRQRWYICGWCSS